MEFSNYKAVNMLVTESWTHLIQVSTYPGLKRAVTMETL
jgi:hypothetical protein